MIFIRVTVGEPKEGVYEFHDHGFKTLKEARTFAKEWGHTIVKCVCGKTKRDGVIHRQDGPCYYLVSSKAQSTPKAEEER